MSRSRSSALGRAPVPEILLGLGGNLGDAAAAIEGALDRLSALGAQVLRRSSLYRTPAWGPVPQPDFINACALAETDLPPRDLLSVTQSIEREFGRVPGPRWGPRAIDIDLLDYEGVETDEPGLTLPHPRLFERAFVLVPLAEIVPGRLIGRRRIAEWAASADRTGIERLPAS